MPLRVNVPGIRAFPTNVRDLELILRSLLVEPDENSTGTSELQNDSVTNAKLRNSGALSVIGRSASTAGDPADISATVDQTFLVRRGTVLGFGPLLDADIPATIARDAEVTAAVVAHEAAADPHTGYLLEAGAVAALQSQSWAFSAVVEFDGTVGFFGASAVSQQAHIADASTSHALNATFSDTEVEAALDALGSKVNEILARLETFGFSATS